MGLFDGAQAVLGSVMGAYFHQGLLHRAARTESDDGDVTLSFADEDVKGQQEACTEAMRTTEGYTDRSVRLLILQRAPSGGLVPEPTADDEVTLLGQRWAIDMIGTDPARAYWEMRGRPAA